jgi:ribosomal-protein-alanine N-acetyltransferase
VDADEIFGCLPVLRTPRLTLRGIEDGDGQALFELFSDDEVTAYYAWEAFTEPRQGAELAAATVEQYRQRQSLRWGLLPAGADRIVGTCGYARWAQQHRYAVLGYDLARAYWGRGLMSEAVTEVIRFGFEEMNLNRVEANVLTGNAASIAVLTRHGFTLEGRFAERAWHRDRFHELQTFGLLRSAWGRSSTHVDRG